ncbi:MAG: hypothetical protein QNL88_00635 [Acidobacteriota bacterium]|nr:hypothetical protein [Acidobacteriota bacterium]
MRGFNAEIERIPQILMVRHNTTNVYVATMVTRFDLRSSDLATLLHKHQSSVTRWLNLGLRRERQDPVFRDRINWLDAEISAAAQRLLSSKR